MGGADINSESVQSRKSFVLQVQHPGRNGCACRIEQSACCWNRVADGGSGSGDLDGDRDGDRRIDG